MYFYGSGMKRWVIITGLVFTGLMFSGCTSKTAVDYSYSPMAAVDTLCMKDNCPKVLTVNFLDLRKDKKIGGLRNAFGGIVSEFVFQDDQLKHAFSSAVTDTLRKTGYKVAMNADRITGADIPATELAGYDYLVGGKITAVAVDTKPEWANVDMKSSVEMYVYIKKLSGDMHEEWIGPIEGSSLTQNYAYMSDISGQATKALNLAIQQCMTKFVSHLKNSGLISE
jgi:hypothetical protein